MTQIFLSYAREDHEFIEDLKSRLEEHDYSTWIDSEDIRLGADWQREIDNGINQSDIVIVVMTPDAKNSEYVTYEWAFALGAKKEVITILLERTELHSRLKALQHVDFCKVHRWDQFFRGLEQIEILASNSSEVESYETHTLPRYIRQAVADLDDIEPEKRERALQILSESNHPDIVEVLAKAVQHSLPDVRIGAAFALARLTKCEDIRFLPGILEAIRVGEIRKRSEAAYVLGVVGDA
jgi:MinD-like ATPase involved in chromosome partitioning or flagellar assembly